MPVREQYAALPVRWTEQGQVRVLLITSRETKRWVMPKGWPIEGTNPWRAAEIEALEEAGVRGRISMHPVGTYHYDKRLGDGSSVRCRVHLFPLKVEKLKRNWKERAERRRRWFKPVEAAEVVHEPELAAILERLRKGAKGDARIREHIKKLT